MKQVIYIYMDTYTNAKRLFNVLFKPSVDKEVLCNKEEWENGECLQIETLWEVWRIVKNPQPKTGYWIDTGSGQECSECHEIQYGYDNFRRFCASCGIRMVEPQESEEV